MTAAGVAPPPHSHRTPLSGRESVYVGRNPLPALSVMSEHEERFRPIHKGIRSMIYELGERLELTDFTSEKESNVSPRS
jgi:hypothetical protein